MAAVTPALALKLHISHESSRKPHQLGGATRTKAPHKTSRKQHKFSRVPKLQIPAVPLPHHAWQRGGAGFRVWRQKGGAHRPPPPSPSPSTAGGGDSGIASSCTCSRSVITHTCTGSAQVRTMAGEERGGDPDKIALISGGSQKRLECSWLQ